MLFLRHFFSMRTCFIFWKILKHGVSGSLSFLCQAAGILSECIFLLERNFKSKRVTLLQWLSCSAREYQLHPIDCKSQNLKKKFNFYNIISIQPSEIQRGNRQPQFHLILNESYLISCWKKNTCSLGPPGTEKFESTTEEPEKLQPCNPCPKFHHAAH